MTVSVWHGPFRPRLDRVFQTSLMIAWLLSAAAPMVRADVLDDIGYTDLASQLGGLLPTGAGVRVSQVEALGGGSYAPDVGASEFVGKDVQLKSGDSGTSDHATSVGRQIYGNTWSTAPGVTHIDVWEADDWLQNGFLRTLSAAAPIVETQQLQNHSWIGGMGSPSASQDALRRLDYAIDRDGFTSVVGLDNGSLDEDGNPNKQPHLLGQSYHTISVGRTDGEHSRGFTWLDGEGRVEPDLVVPTGSTSGATARVSSAAAMLIEGAGGSHAERPQGVKAILLAGATKDEFGANWSRSSTQPLDAVFGAGELNIHRSFQILASGRQPAGNASLVNVRGWDFNESDSSGTRYFFDVPGGHVLPELSVALTWHRDLVDRVGPGFSLASSLTDLDLALHAANGFGVEGPIDVSTSGVDNVEHVYLNEGLGMGGALMPGRYAFEVLSPVSGVDYALAWFGHLELVVGDMNLSGEADFDDVGAFLLGLNNPSMYETAFGLPADVHGDTDGSGLLDFDDVAPFIDLLIFSAQPFTAQRVPEPSTWTLAVLAAGCLSGLVFRVRRRAGSSLTG